MKKDWNVRAVQEIIAEFAGREYFEIRENDTLHSLSRYKGSLFSDDFIEFLLKKKLEIESEYDVELVDEKKLRNFVDVYRTTHDFMLGLAL